MAASAEEKATAGWKIFNKLFTVKVKNIHVHSMDYLNNRGIIAVTSQDAEKEMQSQIQTVSTISGLVNYRLNGAAVEFVYPNDVRTIYDLIVEHLSDWLNIVQRGFYTYLPPPEDLFILEEIAHELHLVVALQEMRRLKKDYRAKPLGQSFLGNKSMEERTLSIDKARTYRHVVPLIIDRGRNYYGINEFGFKE